MAHFRPIKKGDIELVKQNSNHTLSEIEKTLRDFITCPDIVPTNTDENWYKEIITLGLEECKISFRQTKKEDWVKIIFSFNAPILRIVKTYFGHSITTFNLKTDRLLVDFPELTKQTICVTEVTPSSYSKNPEGAVIIKEIRFTFSRTSLSENYPKIKGELEKILLAISKEITLIKEDNLARGKLIEVVRADYHKMSENSEYYSLDREIFETEFDEESPVEFWGSFNHSSKNFITDTDKYPWMPVDVSEDKGLPF